eukprot:Rmarinus@m.2341
MKLPFSLQRHSTSTKRDKSRHSVVKYENNTVVPDVQTKSILKRSNKYSSEFEPVAKYGARARRVVFADELQFFDEETFFSNLVKSGVVVFKPDSKFLDKWTTVRTICWVIEIWRLPFRLITPNRKASFVDIIVDVLMGIDIAVNFNSAYADDDGDLVTDRRKIVMKYLKGRFVFDVLGIVMLYIAIAVDSTSASHELWWISATIFRTLRLRRLFRFFRSLEMNIHIDIRKMSVFKFAILLFGTAHWVGCFWFYIAQLYDNHGSTWLDEYDTLDTYFEKDQTDYYYLNLVAVYWGFNSLANLGNLGIYPSNTLEVFYGVFVIFLQVIFYAYILGTIFHYLVQRDEHEERRTQELQAIQLYATRHRLSEDLNSRLVRYFDFQHRKRNAGERNVQQQVSKALQIKIATHLHSQVIDRVAVLHQTNEAFQKAIMAHLRSMYLMPSETLAKKNDMSLELYFVANGAVEAITEDGTVIHRVSSLSERDPIVGHIAFFVGIPHPFTLRATSKSDVELLVLSRKDYEIIMENFPDQHEALLGIILADFNLNKFGETIQSEVAVTKDTASKEGDEEDDKTNAELRQSVRSALMMKYEMALSSMANAASAGDVTTVRQLLMKGIHADIGDYDARCVLHLAAKDGKLSVAEVLLEHGASVNLKDRWMSTALQIAIEGGHDTMAEFFSRMGGEILHPRPGELLCTAASSGDTRLLRAYIDHGILPDACNYDKVTALHLAASDGNVQVTEYLSQFKRHVNVLDGWGQTPLERAIERKHELVVTMLYNCGGQIGEIFAIKHLCDAARTGDLKQINLLIRSKVDVNLLQYDKRSALHFAAASGNIGAVHILLQSNANEKLKDRWGLTPLDYALRNEYYVCAKLLLSVTDAIPDEKTERKLKDISMERARRKTHLEIQRALLVVEKSRLLDFVVFLQKTRKKISSLVKPVAAIDERVKSIAQAHLQEEDATSVKFSSLSDSMQHKLMRRRINKLVLNCFHLIESLDILRALLRGLAAKKAKDSLIMEQLHVKADLDFGPAEVESVRRILQIQAKEDNDYVAHFLLEPSIKESISRCSGDVARSCSIVLDILSIFEDVPTAVAEKKAEGGDSSDQETASPAHHLLQMMSHQLEELSSKDVGSLGLSEQLNDLFEIDHISQQDVLFAVLSWLDHSNEEGVQYAADSDSDNNSNQPDSGRLSDGEAGASRRMSTLKDNTLMKVPGMKSLNLNSMTVDSTSQAGSEYGALSSRRSGPTVTTFIETVSLGPVVTAQKQALALFWTFCFAKLTTIMREKHSTTPFDPCDRVAVVNLFRKQAGKEDTLKPAGVQKLAYWIGTHGWCTWHTMQTLRACLNREGELSLAGFTAFADELSSQSTVSVGSDRNNEEKKHSWVFSPSHYIVCALAYSLTFISFYYWFAVPFRLAFLSHTPRETDYISPVVYIGEYMADSIFFLHVILRFFTAFINEHSVIVWDHQAIRHHYLTTDFTVDITACFPFDLLCIAAGGSPVFVAWLRVPRLIHTRHSYAFLRRNTTTSVKTVAVMFVVLFCVIHLFACGWFFVASRIGFAEETWYTRYTGYGGVRNEPDNYDAVPEYLICFYFITACISGVGYSEMRPERPLEIAFLTMTILLNLTVISFIISSMSSIVMRGDEQLVAARSGRILVESYIKQNSFSPELEAEIRTQLADSLGGHGHTDMETDLFNMLSHPLKVEVAREIYRSVLEKSSLFSGCSEHFLDSVSVLLSETTIPVDNYVFRVGELCKEMFFLRSGKVEIVVTDENEAETVDETVGPGREVGTVPFIFGVRHHVSARTCNQAVAALVLPREDFNDVLKLYPEEEQIITKNVLVEIEGNATARSRASSAVSSIYSQHTTDEDGKGLAQIIKQAKQNKLVERATSMCNAATKGDIGMLENLLSSSTERDVNVGDYDERYPLHLAASEGLVETVKWLLNNGADTDVRDIFGNTPLVDAVRGGHSEVAKLLYNRGSRLPTNTMLISSLMYACSEGDLDRVKLHIDNGVRADCTGYAKRTPLHVAASCGHLDVVKYLANKAGDINPIDEYGTYPLEDAMRRGHVQVQEYLSSRGGKLSPERVAEVLCWAASRDDVEQLRKLLTGGTDLSICDGEYRTCLHIAAAGGHLSSVDFLLNIPDLDVSPVDHMGCTPYDDAVRHGHSVVALLLKERGSLSGSDPALRAKRKEVQLAYKAKNEKLKNDYDTDLLYQERQAEVTDRLLAHEEEFAAAAGNVRAILLQIFHLREEIRALQGHHHSTAPRQQQPIDIKHRRASLLRRCDEIRATCAGKLDEVIASTQICARVLFEVRADTMQCRLPGVAEFTREMEDFIQVLRNACTAIGTLAEEWEVSNWLDRMLRRVSRNTRITALSQAMSSKSLRRFGAAVTADKVHPLLAIFQYWRRYIAERKGGRQYARRSSVRSIATIESCSTTPRRRGSVIESLRADSTESDSGSEGSQKGGGDPSAADEKPLEKKGDSAETLEELSNFMPPVLQQKLAATLGSPKDSSQSRSATNLLAVAAAAARMQRTQPGQARTPISPQGPPISPQQGGVPIVSGGTKLPGFNMGGMTPAQPNPNSAQMMMPAVAAAPGVGVAAPGGLPLTQIGPTGQQAQGVPLGAVPNGSPGIPIPLSAGMRGVPAGVMRPGLPLGQVQQSPIPVVPVGAVPLGVGLGGPQALKNPVPGAYVTTGASPMMSPASPVPNGGGGGGVGGTPSSSATTGLSLSQFSTAAATSPVPGSVPNS